MAQFNPWHDVNLETKENDVFDAIIEIPAGSKGKYELDKESGLLRLDRVLYTPMVYPANYGFYPKTYCDDNDPLDVLVLSQENIYPRCIVSSRIVGVMKMIDGGEEDYKVIAVCSDDKSVAHINDITDIPEYLLNEIEVFFKDYKKLQKKEVQVDGYENKEFALKVMSDSIKLYNETFNK